MSSQRIEICIFKEPPDNKNMIERKIEIVNKLGLHARAATKLVKLANRFESEIQISCQTQDLSNIDQNKVVSGKSIMGVMMLAAGKGSEITLIVEGEDEQLAADQIEALIEDRFGEEE